MLAPDHDSVRSFPGATSAPFDTETEVGTPGATTVVFSVAYAEDKPELLLAPRVFTLKVKMPPLVLGAVTDNGEAESVVKRVYVAPPSVDRWIS